MLRIDGFYEVMTIPTKDQMFAEEYDHMEAYFVIRGGSITIRSNKVLLPIWFRRTDFL
jgi:hypothetical protein